jgi:immune inhibitor A
VGGGSVGIDDVENEQQSVNDPRVFTIDGRYLGTEVTATFRGVYIQNGKKHVKLQ